jgi:ribosomal protein S18 acetylase RimI-like enzyme
MWKRLTPNDAEPVWSDGFGVRTYVETDGERVHALLDDAYAGWDRGYVARTHDDWVKWMTDHDEFDPGLWFLVERNGDLVGAALHWKEHRGDGWVKDIVVRESQRGHGLGNALLLHAFREYRRRGAQRVGLKVDSSNPTGALELYERTGFETDRRYGIWIKRL